MDEMCLCLKINYVLCVFTSEIRTTKTSVRRWRPRRCLASGMKVQTSDGNSDLLKTPQCYIVRCLVTCSETSLTGLLKRLLGRLG